jgi:hypothetical protein
MKSPAGLRGFLFYFFPSEGGFAMEPGPPGVLFDPVVPLFMEPLCMAPFSLPIFPAVGLPGPLLCPVGPEPPPPAAAPPADPPPPPSPPAAPCASANAGARAIPAANAIVTSLICLLPFKVLPGIKGGEDNSSHPSSRLVTVIQQQIMACRADKEDVVEKAF